MIIYLVKSTLLLGLLYGLYKLLLENEKIHHINRFFLLFALVFGLTAPLISFEIHPEQSIAGIKMQHMERVVNAPAEAVSKSVESVIIPKPAASTQTETGAHTPAEPGWSLSNTDMLFGLYGLITLFLLIRFVGGLIEIRNKVKAGSHEKTDLATLVLLNEPITPQSFFSFIFLEKEPFESGKIEAEILDHELTHIRQLHSLDVLFVEFLKVVFWFNPLMYLYKHAIQLNHEFLADESVVGRGSSVTDYQNMLLRLCGGDKPMSTTSSISYSLTKKRLRMMSSPKSIWWAFPKILFAVSALSILTFVSCSDTTNKARVYTSEELFAMIPTQRTVRTDIELRSEANDSLYRNSSTYFGPNGEPYTGEQNGYIIETDRHIYKHHFVNGKRMQTEYYYYGENGEYQNKGVIKYSLKENGNTVTRFFTDKESDTLVLWLERIEDGTVIKQKFYHLNGQLRRTDSYLLDSSTPGLDYHGLKSEYDSSGNLLLQERYEDGELIEKIK